jgi:hypothetical protein
MKHTPEPWGQYLNHITDSDGWTMGDLHFGQRFEGISVKFDAEANAARIVACVNACAGMDDPAAEIERLRAEREEIMFCLKELMSIVDIHGSATDNDFAWAEMGYARKIISKVKGTNP